MQKQRKGDRKEPARPAVRPGSRSLAQSASSPELSWEAAHQPMAQTVTRFSSLDAVAERKTDAAYATDRKTDGQFGLPLPVPIKSPVKRKLAQQSRQIISSDSRLQSISVEAMDGTPVVLAPKFEPSKLAYHNAVLLPSSWGELKLHVRARDTSAQVSIHRWDPSQDKSTISILNMLRPGNRSGERHGRTPGFSFTPTNEEEKALVKLQAADRCDAPTVWRTAQRSPYPPLASLASIPLICVRCPRCPTPPPLLMLLTLSSRRPTEAT